MENWNLIAQGLGADLSEIGAGEIFPALAGLEAAFRPLVRGLPVDAEPALVFDPAAEPRT